ncbi:MAG: D-aminoacyl-tRNA deacylase [Oscillospiraceae bacterium]|nr:D-aminoacyl-tRNA deacylase [Oscillospiraceae bacterium]
MRAVLQRVSGASVSVGGEIISSIGRGYVVLLGVGVNDTKENADKMADKIQKLRIFPDENGKTNLSVEDIDGGILIISQFTLYADSRKGNRPSFTGAASPGFAEELYEYFAEICEGRFKKTGRGVFGANMQVSLVNDGPFTVILEIE